MALGSTKHELEIRAFVKDHVSKGMATIRKEIGATGKTTKTSAKATGEFSKSLSAIGQSAATALVGFVSLNAGLRLYRMAIRSASEEAKRMIAISSEVEESQSALAFIFEDAGAQQEAFIRKLSATTGRFSNDIRNFEVELAGIVKPLGFTADETARIANTLAEVGVDLASFFNKSDSDVFLKIIQGISGETEGMRRLGVDLREAAVQAEAFRIGIGGPNGELSEAEKTIARLSLVVERSSDKLGDAQRTADSFANTMRRVTSSISEARAEAGVELKAAILSAIDAGGGLDNVLAAIVVTLRFVAAEAEGAILIMGEMAKIADRVLNTQFGAIFDETRLELLIKRLEAITGQSVGPTIAGQASEIKALGDNAFYRDWLSVTEKDIRERIAAAMEDGAQSGLEAARATVTGLSGSGGGGGADGVSFGSVGFSELLKIEIQLADTARDKIQLLKVQRELERGQLEIKLLQNVAGLEDLKNEQHILEMYDAVTAKMAEALQLAEDEAQARAATAAAIEKHRFVLNAARMSVGELSSAFANARNDADAFSHALDNIISNLIQMAAQAALTQVAFAFLTQGLGIPASAVSSVLSAKGNVFAGGSVVPFASGGIVSQPTVFPMARGGVGLMGESGPEAIMPLRRGRGGRLGVESSGGGLNIEAGAIVVVAQPGQDERQIALAVMHQLQVNPMFRAAMGKGGAG